MKDLGFAKEVHLKLGAPSSRTVESLRLLRAFLRLAPQQRFEVVRLVEDLAAEDHAGEDVVPDHPLS